MRSSKIYPFIGLAVLYSNCYRIFSRNEIPPLPASFNVVPTHTFDDKLDINPVKGINLTLYHAPGETNDQIIVWWPERRMLFPADNIYRTFPNLYAIRGTSARCVNQKYGLKGNLFSKKCLEGLLYGKLNIYYILSIEIPPRG